MIHLYTDIYIHTYKCRFLPIILVRNFGKYIYVVAVLICISFITNEVEHIEYHFIELCEPLCHDKAVTHEGEHI